MKNDKIVIQSVAESRSTSGGTVESWSTFSTVWADVKQISGNENFNANMLIYSDFKQFTIYYNHGQDITVKMRIVYRGDNYNITSVSHKDRLETILIGIRYDDE